MDENIPHHQEVKKGIRLNVSGNLLIVSSCHSYSGVSSGLGLGGRGEINAFSESSRARLRRYLRETKAEYQTMVTLTYPVDFSIDGTTSKEHLRRFLQELRRGCRRFPAYWSAFWFMEFTKAGQIHFHILCTDYYDYNWIAYKWWTICGQISESHLHAGTRIEKIRAGRNGIASYCAKYAAKFDQKLIPESFGNAGRFWGVQGYRERVAAATFIPPGLEAQKLVERGLKSIKNMILSEKMREISSLMPNLPENIKIYRISSKSTQSAISRQIRFIELFVALTEKREANFEDEICELYDQMVEDHDYMIEPTEEMLWRESVMKNQTAQNHENLMKRMRGESYAGYYRKVETLKS